MAAEDEHTEGMHCNGLFMTFLLIKRDIQRNDTHQGAAIDASIMRNVENKANWQHEEPTSLPHQQCQLALPQPALCKGVLPLYPLEFK